MVGSQQASTEVPIEVNTAGASEDALLWQQVNTIVRTSVATHRAREESSPPGRIPVERGERRGWRTVAPGIVVSPEEYERRFGSFDLEGFRQAMPPELFLAFVRHLGAINGGDDTDVVRSTAVPDR